MNRLDDFVASMTALVSRDGITEATILDEGGELLRGLVAQDDWLPEEFTRPHPVYYQQYLLHCDPQSRFCVVSFVWGPGQRTPIHDHTVWGMIGMLRGAEASEYFDPADPTVVTGRDRLEPGMVDKVSPSIGDVHRVTNAYDDRVSISIHVYGADIGMVSRHVFDAETGTPKAFVSGYANRVT